jgi:hypothetical protein
LRQQQRQSAAAQAAPLMFSTKPIMLQLPQAILHCFMVLEMSVSFLSACMFAWVCHLCIFPWHLDQSSNNRAPHLPNIALMTCEFWPATLPG